jgi:cellulose biosynthesis protein BcsQ
LRTFAVINAKGGVCKTTTALCLAVGTATGISKGREPILLVDADSRAQMMVASGNTVAIRTI